MLAELERHPHARSVLAPAFAAPRRPSHAYLFHGPGGAGKREAARALAAELLADGAPDPENVRARVRSRAHPDLTWVVPSGAHEILVSDIAEPVIAAASRTPFEARRRVFVIERADELGDEAANRMLKTLEEPASFVHIVLLTDRLAEILPTIRSRCQSVRFEPPSEDQAVSDLRPLGVSDDVALACVRLALGDADRARLLAEGAGQELRSAALDYARAPLAGGVAERRPWTAVLAAVRAQGDVTAAELDARQVAELELTARRDRKRVETEWSDRIRRGRRRVQTQALDLALQLVSLWYADLLALGYRAPELVRNVDRPEELESDAGPDPRRLRRAIELVEDTRQRFQLNVSEDLACEALAYRLEQTLAG